MRLVSKLKSMAVALMFTAALPATAGVVDFDGTGAPSVYDDATALSNYYASLGLVFSGVSGVGGSILNQAGEFGFMARSGTDLLVFNVERNTGKDERISFASAQESVSVHMATYDEGFFSLTAFDVGGNILAFVTQAATRDWQALTLNHAGIRSVVVASTTDGWGLDDLSFNAGAAAQIPEPGGMALLGIGLLGLAALRRKVG